MDWDEDALELDRLAAELRVSQSPAPLGRRNGGGTTDVSTGERDPSGLQGTPLNVGVSVETVHMEVETQEPGLFGTEEPIDMFGAQEDPRSPYPTVAKKT
jgi:hypothetical protein